MARPKTPRKGLESNAHLQKILEPGAGNVSILRGFIGPSERDGYVRVFPSLADTSVSVDIAEDDIVATGDVLDNQLGKRVIWVKTGSRITVTKTRTTEYGVLPKTISEEDLASIRAGRLRMQVKSAASDVCVSVCNCSTCECHCTSWCGVCTCPPPVMK